MIFFKEIDFVSYLTSIVLIRLAYFVYKEVDIEVLPKSDVRVYIFIEKR